MPAAPTTQKIWPCMCKDLIESTHFSCYGVPITFREMSVNDYANVRALVPSESQD